jgi:hypothetical protein
MCVDCLYVEDELDPDHDYRTIEADMTFTVAGDDCLAGCEVPTTVLWSETDPWAIKATFQPGTSCEMSQTVSRESLAMGLSRATGIGHVRFRPALANPKMCEMILRSPTGEMALWFDVTEVALFLAAVDREIHPAVAEG